jgi:hypothetical protein
VFRPTLANKVVARLGNRFPRAWEQRWAWIFPAWFLAITLRRKSVKPVDRFTGQRQDRPIKRTWGAEIAVIFAGFVDTGLVYPLLRCRSMPTPYNRLPSRPAICRDMTAALWIALSPHAVRCAIGIQIMLATSLTVASR